MAAPSAETFRLEIAPDAGYAGGWRCSFIFADGMRNHLAAPDEADARRLAQAYIRRTGLTLVHRGESLPGGGMQWGGQTCGRS